MPIKIGHLPVIMVVPVMMIRFVLKFEEEERE
jgi:hypothetical protein